MSFYHKHYNRTHDKVQGVARRADRKSPTPRGSPLGRHAVRPPVTSGLESTIRPITGRRLGVRAAATFANKATPQITDHRGVPRGRRKSISLFTDLRSGECPIRS